MIPLFCASCTKTARADQSEGEDFYAVKARLRAELGASCPRGDSKLCPMRGESAPNLEDLAVAHMMIG